MSNNNRVLTIHKKTTDKIDWFNREKPYDNDVIKSIKDPTGDNDVFEITSIPSPFAKIDLVVSAFRFINNIEGDIDKKLCGNTIYHKIVSETIDIAELFYNYESLTDKIRIVSWNSNDLTWLLGNEETGKKVSGRLKHKRLGETLKLFLNQDKKAYNFDKQDEWFFLEYKEAGSKTNILGGTSPATVFFPSSNNKSIVNINIGGRKLFRRPENNKHYTALFERKDHSFIEFFAAFVLDLSTSNGAIINPIDEVKKYIELNIDIIKQRKNDQNFSDIADKLITLSQVNNKEGILKKFDTLHTADGKEVKILDKPYKKKKSEGDTICSGSEFRLKVTNTVLQGKYDFCGSVTMEENEDEKNDNEKKAKIKIPLVLPPDNFYHKLKYVTTFWDPNYTVPYNPKEKLEDRYLPGYHIKYPWISVNDFFEPYLISVPYSINKNNFFDGNLKSKNGKIGYLSPIKPMFFEFFDVEFLKGQQPDAKKNFELVENTGGAITAILRLPIMFDKNSEVKYITFERTYFPLSNNNVIPSPDLDKNEGYILDSILAIGLLPKIKVKNAKKSHYRIAFIGNSIGAKYMDEFKLTFAQINNDIEAKEFHRSNAEKQAYTSKYYKLNNNFDYIRITNNNNIHGILIPEFEVVQEIGSKSAVFSIDFGTTYTHIEYMIDGNTYPFEIKDELSTLYYEEDRHKHKDLLQFMNWEFVPNKVGSNSDYNFPQRTVIGHHNRISDTNAVLLTNTNIIFPFEKEKSIDSISIETNLKWSGKSNNKFREIFWEQLIFHIRNFALRNPEIDYSKIKIVWSHPSGMSTGTVGEIKKMLRKFSKKYFSGNIKKISAVAESLSPLYYYQEKQGVNFGARPILSIDIGGETTDIVVRENNDKKPLISSFRFGANALYGNIYGGKNGIVEKYTKYFKNLINQNEETRGFNRNFDEFMERVTNPADIISFFFSFEKNRLFDGKDSFNFSEQLKNDNDLKIVFLFFYSAIIYHSFRLMQTARLKAPEKITFSGTASKMIDFITPDVDILMRYTKILAKKVFSEQENVMDIHTVSNPKEITAIGSLLANEEFDVYKLNRFLISFENESKILGNEFDQSSVVNNHQLNEKIKLATLKEVNIFIDIFFNVDNEFSLDNYFNISIDNIDKIKEVSKRQLETYLGNGLTKLSGIKNEKLLETLFFYPLIGSIKDLINYVIDKDK